MRSPGKTLLAFALLHSVFQGQICLLPHVFLDFLLSSALYGTHLCMKYSLGISNFLEEISSLSHSVVFLYFFALIAEEGLLMRG